MPDSDYKDKQSQRQTDRDRVLMLWNGTMLL